MRSPSPAQSRTRSRWIDIAAMVFVSALAFGVSFHALSTGAIRAGFPRELAWAVPFLVDGWCVICMRQVALAALEGETDRAAWAGMIATAGLSLAGNVHQALPRPDSRAYAALAPLVLVASFHALMSAWRKAANRRLAAAELEALRPAQRARVLWDGLSQSDRAAMTGGRLSEAIPGLSDRSARLLLADWKRPGSNGQATSALEAVPTPEGESHAG